MSGTSGAGSSRSTGGNRGNVAPSIFIDLTEDNDKGKILGEKRKEKPKEKRSNIFIDLSISSDDEPSVPANAPRSAKSVGKAPGKAPSHQNAAVDGGAFNLVSDSESDDEPSISKSSSVCMTSGAPLKQGTARKTAVLHRKSNSGSIGPASFNLTQNKKTSASSSARSTPGASKDHGTLSRSGSTSKLSRVISHQSSSTATAPSISNRSYLDATDAKNSDPQQTPFVNPLAPLSMNSSSQKKEFASNIPSGQLKSGKGATPSLKRPSSPNIKESPLSTKKAPSILDRYAENGNGEIPREILQPDGNRNSHHVENEIMNNESPIVAEVIIPRKVVSYQKKGNHGGARRGPAWERQKNQKFKFTEGTNTSNSSADDDDDDFRPAPQKKRKRGQDPDKYLVSEPSSNCSVSPSHKKSDKGKHVRWEGRIDPVSKQRSLILPAPFEEAHQELSLEEIRASLVSLEETMMEDFGLSVRSLLEKRQLRAQAALNTSFDDDESPFVSLKAADENTEGAIKLDIRSTRKGKTPTYVVPIIIGDGGVERTPSYVHHTNVIRNHLTGDDDILRYIPLVSTSNEEKAMNKFEKELNTAYAERNDDSREKEQISQIDMQIDPYLKNLPYSNCDREALVRYLLGHQSDKLPYPTREKRFILKSLGGPLSGDLLETMEIIAETMSEGFDIDIATVVMSQSRFKNLLDELKDKFDKLSGDQSSAPERLETMAQFSCLICHNAVCTTHGEYDYRKIYKDIPDDDSSEIDSPDRSSFKKSDYEYVWERFIMHSSDVMRKHNARDHSQNNQYWHPEHWNTDLDTRESCGDECYRGRTEWKNYAWTQKESDELKRKISIIKPHSPCFLVDIVDKPCWQIYSKILELEERFPISKRPNLHPRKPSEAAEWYNPKAVPRNRGLRPGWQDDTVAHMHDLRVQSVSCVHDGPCRREMNCYCVINNLLCEQFCGCPDDCGRRFAGCSCHSEALACASDTCICFQMNRECGDQCDTCGAIPRINPQDRYKKELFQDGCQNIAIQRGVNKKLILGKSLLEDVGFGLFTAEPVKKGDFLYEYAGEVISDNEAERRGVGYDARCSSFLFDLNKEWIVDAERLGNKTRFINHAGSEADGLNCVAKILLVNGEHRISFRASRDIKIGEELFFNYGKSFAEIHGLNKKIGDTKKNKGKGSKGFMTGEAEQNGLGSRRGARIKKMEMADALEGGATKKKKGWQKGRSRGNASKKAKDQDHDIAGPSNAYYDEKGENDDGNVDMIEDVNSVPYPGMIKDSNEEDKEDGDEISMGKPSADIKMEDVADDGEEEGEAIRRSRRKGKMPLRYTR